MGYGTIGLTLAKAHEQARLTLADVNPRAVALCKRNAEFLNLSPRVTILQSDIYEKIEGKYKPSLAANRHSLGHRCGR